VNKSGKKWTKVDKSGQKWTKCSGDIFYVKRIHASLRPELLSPKQPLFSVSRTYRQTTAISQWATLEEEIISKLCQKIRLLQIPSK
jgi:hypothetical protein